MTLFRMGTGAIISAGVIVLTLITAFIHLRLGSFGLPQFTLNGLGYLVLLALLYLPVSQLAPYRHIVRWALVGYTALTIVLWIFLGAPYTPTGYFTKLVEIGIIVLLVVEHRMTSATGQTQRPSRAS